MYIVIVGGGMVGSGLIRTLLDNKHDVVLIEQDKETCDRLYAETGVIAVNASATNVEALNEAGISKADVLVAATGKDADNLAVAILAKSFEVPQIIVRMMDPAYKNAYIVAGVHSIVRMTDLMISQMIMDIENPQVRRITSIGGGKADIFLVIVPEHAKIAGRSIQDIVGNRHFPSQCVFIAVYNKKTEQFSIPRGQQIINEGDELFLISTAENIKKAVDLLIAQKRI
ncbi:MAG: TrkA family potassium uptake protein [Sedimentisphaerales bacterium]|nr:TrkA family potassium uptake protein [Sedimentisphaerales bacterium]